MDELFVLIRREDGGRVAEYPLSKISGIRWDWQDGGYQRHYASPRLYGYISYKDAKLVDCSGRHEFAGCARYRLCQLVVRRTHTMQAMWKPAIMQAKSRNTMHQST